MEYHRAGFFSQPGDPSVLRSVTIPPSLLTGVASPMASSSSSPPHSPAVPRVFHAAIASPPRSMFRSVTPHRSPDESRKQHPLQQQSHTSAADENRSRLLASAGRRYVDAAAPLPGQSPPAKASALQELWAASVTPSPPPPPLQHPCREQFLAPGHAPIHGMEGHPAPTSTVRLNGAETAVELQAYRSVAAECRSLIELLHTENERLVGQCGALQAELQRALSANVQLTSGFAEKKSRVCARLESLERELGRISSDDALPAAAASAGGGAAMVSDADSETGQCCSALSWDGRKQQLEWEEQLARSETAREYEEARASLAIQQLHTFERSFVRVEAQRRLAEEEEARLQWETERAGLLRQLSDQEFILKRKFASELASCQSHRVQGNLSGQQGAAELAKTIKDIAEDLDALIDP